MTKTGNAITFRIYVATDTFVKFSVPFSVDNWRALKSKSNVRNLRIK